MIGLELRDFKIRAVDILQQKDLTNLSSWASLSDWSPASPKRVVLAFDFGKGQWGPVDRRLGLEKEDSPGSCAMWPRMGWRTTLGPDAFIRRRRWAETQWTSKTVMRAPYGSREWPPRVCGLSAALQGSSPSCPVTTLPRALGLPLVHLILILF